MVGTKCVGDNYKMLVTVLAPTVGRQHLKIDTNITATLLVTFKEVREPFGARFFDFH